MARLIAKLSGSRVRYERDKLKYSVPRSYVPDFTVLKSDGTLMFLEVKGYFRPEDRTKMRCVKHDNPEADIRLVFASDNKISSRSAMRYSDWAKKYGYPFAVGTIPREWFA